MGVSSSSVIERNDYLYEDLIPTLPSTYETKPNKAIGKSQEKQVARID